MFENSDFVELGYHNIERIRALTKRKPEQQRRLDEHDALEKRIHENPREVMTEAHKALDHGTDLLLKLIRSRNLEQKSFYVDGTIADEHDEAFDCFESRLDYLVRQLIRLANSGVPRARRSVFYKAKTLTETFLRLAAASPSDFIDCAESSLTMPSLRSRNPRYTADAEAIAKSIRLSEKHPAGTTPADRVRLGELCGDLVAKILDSIMWERQAYEWDVETLERLKRFSETASIYREVTIEAYLKSQYYPTLFDRMMISGGLPDFTDDPGVWWEKGVLPRLREKFERLKKNPSLNAALWNELAPRTSKRSDESKWKPLSDNCFNKVIQFAQLARAKDPGSNSFS